MSQEKEFFYRKVKCAMFFLGHETDGKIDEAIKIAKVKEL